MLTDSANGRDGGPGVQLHRRLQPPHVRRAYLLAINGFRTRRGDVCGPGTCVTQRHRDMVNALEGGER